MTTDHVKVNEIKLYNNKKLVVFDGLFDMAAMAGLYTGLCGLPFKIGNTNATEVQNRTDGRLTCDLDEVGVDQMRLFNDHNMKYFDQHLPDGFSIYRAYVNLGLPCDTQQMHVDNYWKEEGLTVLCYGNKEWDKNWGGETFFYDDEGKEILYVSPLIPGRFIIFDSSIPHLARPQTTQAPTYRFSIAVKLGLGD